MTVQPTATGPRNQVKRARASSTHDTKAEAAAAGRDTAVERGTEHVIKKQDGTIGEKNTYPRSRDPRDIEG
ncbi:DUF2188 domain-containing protein [Micromonospora sp. WP24]|uniref:DUF2188 domain-containing protein n=1 Tax=Micromonospora sp. WP24 TaxID=2604469 RepID=UPI0021049A6E|nr:DUF2188 domain-containing protein [Micromonospora sp. WP24]